MEIPLAYDVTPLTVNASAGTARGLRTPFSPERQRTIVTRLKRTLRLDNWPPNEGLESFDY